LTIKCHRNGDAMENKRIVRTIVFDRNTHDSNTIDNAYIVLKDWNSYSRKTTQELKKMLKMEHIPFVKLQFEEFGTLLDDTFRILIYKTHCCHILKLKPEKTSHLIQVSITDDYRRSGWNNGELLFNAKVFAKSIENVKNIVEDIILDIQYFYMRSYDIWFDTIDKKTSFSSLKAVFAKEKHYICYLGEVKDAEYVSFASFCRDENNLIDYAKYIELWNEFDHWIDLKNYDLYNIISAEDIWIRHPKHCQISKRKLSHMLNSLDNGSYLLIRTEKCPKDKRIFMEIATRFGLKQWKTGKLLIVDLKTRFTWLRLLPYISIYKFDWSK